MKLKFHDPVGPGTPAWDAFDRAQAAHAEFKRTGELRLYKRFWNQRQYMIQLLARHNQPSKPWITALDRATRVRNDDT